MNRNKEYCSFLISMKQVQTEDFQTWIVALRDVQTGRQQIFSNLNGLIQFLQTEFSNPEEQKDTGLSAVSSKQSIQMQ